MLPLEATSPQRVLLEDLFKTASEDESLLPAAIGEVLGISVAEVMDRYYRTDSNSNTLERRVTEDVSRLMTAREGKAWLRDMAIDSPYIQDDTF
jgi:hypothetical protein